MDGEILGICGEGFSFPDDPSHSCYTTMEQEITDGLANPLVDSDESHIPTVDELRITAYGSIGDQQDMQYWDAVNSTTTWVDHIAAVKLANPKA